MKNTQGSENNKGITRRKLTLHRRVYGPYRLKYPTMLRWCVLIPMAALVVVACNVLDPEPTTVVEPTVAPVAEFATPRQLTTDPGADLDPAWDPRGGAIAYMTSKPGATERPFDIGAVSGDGTNVRFIASGPNRDIGIGGTLTWVGQTGLLMTNERISVHEYMTFDSTKAPFTRTASNGNDAAFVSKLVIPGGMGGDGISVSRDGKMVMWKNRTSHNPASYVITVRVAEYASLSGQSTAAFGRVLLTHSAATSGPDFDRGFSLSPDGSFFVISLKSGNGYDLVVYDTTSGKEIRRLTSTGASQGALNADPDISPDGQWVAFSTQANAEARSDLSVVRIGGTGLRRITNTAEVSEGHPSWSPNGAELAYDAQVHTDAAPNWDIYAIPVSSPN